MQIMYFISDGFKKRCDISQMQKQRCYVYSLYLYSCSRLTSVSCLTEKYDNLKLLTQRISVFLSVTQCHHLKEDIPLFIYILEVCSSLAKEHYTFLRNEQVLFLPKGQSDLSIGQDTCVYDYNSKTYGKYIDAEVILSLQQREYCHLLLS